MAKGEQKGNRESKKPKKEKIKTNRRGTQPEKRSRLAAKLRLRQKEITTSRLGIDRSASQHGH